MGYGLMVPAVAITLFIALLLVRRQLHRALAPERVVGTASPASVGLAFSEIRFPTRNGKTLAGWFVPATGPGPHPAVAVVHGWGGNAETMLPLAAPLHAAGFAVLLFEARCHGRSEEDSFASLPRFAEDCAAAVDWLRIHAGLGSGTNAGIALVGHSVGAGAALLAAARDPGIAAVVSIAAFTHPEAMMRRWFAFRGIPQCRAGHRPSLRRYRADRHDPAPALPGAAGAWRRGCNRASGGSACDPCRWRPERAVEDRGRQPRRLRGSGARTAGAGGFPARGGSLIRIQRKADHLAIRHSSERWNPTEGSAKPENSTRWTLTRAKPGPS